MKNEEEKLIKHAFKKVDELYDVTPPNHATLSVLLKDKKEEYKKSQKRELMAFMIIAFGIILLLTTLLMKATVIYFVIQVLGICLALIYTYFERKNRHKEDQCV
ncbi:MULTISPECIES: DUF5345 family protein [Bacillus]|uniref:DUF5345 family protein n=1 Tax=Bacillus TaxID=1386 RepID=UPI00031B4DF3|nr:MULTISPECIES: DUF5345 family protein [Bacillus]